MFVSHHTLKWTRTCRSHGRHPHAHTAHFLLNRHSRFVLCRVSENDITFAKYRPSKFGKHGIVGNERQIASFAIEAIAELNKNISVMNIASSAILAIQTGT